MSPDSSCVWHCLNRATETSPGSGVTHTQTRLRVTYDELKRSALATAAALIHFARPGNRVAFIGSDVVCHLVTCFAAARIGAIFVPVNTKWKLAEVQYALRDCSPTVLIVDSSVSSEWTEALVKDPAMPKMFVTTSQKIKDKGFLCPVPPMSAYGDLPFAIFYTSGTTGPPKGVVLTHTNMMTQVKAKLDTIGYRESTVYLHLAPLFHLGGANSTLAVTLAGGQIVLPQSTAAVELLGVITHWGINTLVVVPTILDAVVEAFEHGQTTSPSVADVLCGGSAMPRTLCERTFRVFPLARLTQTYGMTETASSMTFLRLDQHCAPARHISSGKPPRHITIGIVDRETGLPISGEGEIVTQGEHVMRCYWNCEAANKEAFTHIRGKKWLKTGDIGYIDDNGDLYVTGRKKDVVKTGGEIVSAREVELVIERLSIVAECVVVAIPDRRYGEVVAAAVVTSGPEVLTVQAVQDHVRLHLANYKVPKRVYFTSVLPRNSGGKVNKRRLAAAISRSDTTSTGKYGCAKL